MEAGEIITPDSIRSVRPGYGLPPKYFDEVVGSRTKAKIKANTACTSSMIDKEI